MQKVFKDYPYLLPSIILTTLLLVSNLITITHYYNNFDYLALDNPFHYIIITLFLYIPVLYLTSFNKTVFIVVNSLYVFISLALSYIFFRHNLVINFFTIDLMLEADKTLIKYFINFYDILVILLFIFLTTFPFFFLSKTKRQRINNTRLTLKRFGTDCLCIIFGIICLGSIINFYFTFDSIALITVILLELKLLYLAQKQPKKVQHYFKVFFIGFCIAKISLQFLITTFENKTQFISPFNFIKTLYINSYEKSIQLKELPGNFNYDNKEPLKFIIIIGESARSDHFSLNGYHRNTNPKLSKIKNLVSFPNTLSCGASTRVSIPCLLTRKETGDLWRNKTFNIKSIKDIREKSFVGVFNKLKFETSWFSHHNFNRFERTHTLSSESKYLFTINKQKTNGDDIKVIESFNKFLKLNYNKNILAILHTMGSHNIFRYKNYPNSFCKFTENCKKDKNKINRYDNTILYTDFIISKAVESLKDQNAILLYIGDHGEIFSNKYAVHENYICDSENNCQFLKEQHMVPMIWWASNKFLTNPQNKQRFEKLKEKKNLKLTQDVIFHSVLGCTGIKSKIIKKSLNLCE